MTRNRGSSVLLSRRPVPGCAFAPGARVTVLLDGEDETADLRFHGARGEVTGLLFDDLATQFPAEPLVEVRVDGLGCEWFFPRELLSVE
jgi:hypothetical protein